jgi:hypothetical protein
MQKEFTQEEKRLEKDMEQHLYSSNWCVCVAAVP